MVHSVKYVKQLSIIHMIHLTWWNFSVFLVFQISEHHSRGIWKLDSVIQLLYKLASLGRVSQGDVSIQNLTIRAAESNVALAIDMVVLIISPVKKDTFLLETKNIPSYFVEHQRFPWLTPPKVHVAHV